MLRETLRGHVLALCDCSWAHSNRYIATSSDDGTVKVWCVEDGRCLHSLYGHTGPVLCCDFNQNDTLIASASCDESIRLWDTSSGYCVSVLPAHSDPVTTVQFSSDSTMLLSASYDGNCRLWDITSNSCLKTVNFGAPVGYARFTKNLLHIVISTLCGSVYMLDSKLERIRHCTSFREQGSADRQPLYANHQDGMVIAGSREGLLWIWDFRRRATIPLRVCTATEVAGNLRNLAAYNFRNETLVTCSYILNELNIWRLRLE